MLLPYPELYAVVGSRVPDYQGMFLRGYGGNAAGLGVQQGDAIRNITGALYTAYESYWNDFIGDAFDANGVFYLSQPVKKYGIQNREVEGLHDNLNRLNFDASRVVPTANENRPVNKAVRYLIRAKS